MWNILSKNVEDAGENVMIFFFKGKGDRLW